MVIRLCHCGRPKPCADHPPSPKPRFSDRTAAWQRARKAALHRDGHRCVRCGATSTETLRLHVHHIAPRAQGGTHALKNLLTLCDVCHPRVERGKRRLDPTSQ
jgi:5-methylcytosine-specific restriction endonuclease McrA